MLNHSIDRQHLRHKQDSIRKEAPVYHCDDDDDEEEEEEENINYKPSQKKRSSSITNNNRALNYSTSPEPSSPTVNKGRKKAWYNPNRKDKIGRTRLFAATTAGHLDKVKELIEEGAIVNIKDNANWTPLHEAAINKRFEIAQHLLECGAEVNVRGLGLETPLHDACQSDTPSIVKLLVNAGANVFALNEKNCRPIDLCTNQECKAILEARMKELDHVIHRDAKGKSLLHHACSDNETERALDLIQQGADVNAKDNQEATPLHLACSQGHLNVVKLLIEQGALVNILGTDKGDTPLHQASRYGQKDIVQYLINHAEADVNMKNEQGENPYHVAAAFPRIRQILTARMDELRLEKEACHALDDTARKMALQNEPERQLTREERKIQNYMRTFANLSNDAPPKSKLDDIIPLPAPVRKKKRAPAINTRKSASVERDVTSPKKSSATVKLDPFKKDNSGKTQLHKFATRGDAEAVESLLESGANTNEKDYAGWTALHEAALKGHIEVVKILLKHGANVNSKGGDMDTPLHDATENNHCDIVELLLEHGADPFARNVHNAEPIDIATNHEFQDIILVLQNANPVKKKKKKLVLKKDNEPMTDVQSSNKSSSSPTTATTTKKRRLIQAADLEKIKSNDDDKEEEVALITPTRLKKLRQRSASPPSNLVSIKMEDEFVVNNQQQDDIIKEKENLNKTRYIPNKKNYATTTTTTSIYDNIPSTQPKVIDNNQHSYPRHSPIHTPPPDQWTVKQKQQQDYSPLYTVQISSDNKYYVIDLQVCLFLGLDDLNDYSHLLSNKKLINVDGKSKLWSTLKHMIREEKSTFIARHLYFIALDDVVDLIKREYNHLSDSLLTITLDIGYEEETSAMDKKYCSLPPKIAMKMKKCGYKFQQYSTF